MKNFIYFLSLICLLATSCRNKNPNLNQEEINASLEKQAEEKKVLPEIPEGYTPPPGITHTAKLDLSEPIIRLDVVAGLKNEKPVKLSDLAKEVIYFRIDSLNELGDLSQIVPIPNGYLGVAYNGVWLLKDDFSKDRMLVQCDVEAHAEKEFFYIKPTTQLRTLYYDSGARIIHYIYDMYSENRNMIQYIGIMSLDEWLNASSTLTAGDLKKQLKSAGNNFIFGHKEGFGTTGYYAKGLYMFDQKGDSLCYFTPGFQAGSDPKGTTRGAEGPDRYFYKGDLYYRQAYTDTIYKIINGSTFQPVYRIDLGKYQVSRSDGMSISYDLSEKYLVHNVAESDNLFLLRVTQNYDCPNTRMSGDVKFFQLIYNKQTGELSSFTDRSNQSQPGGISNDLDGGLPFWPNLQLADKFYMKHSGKELKKLYSKDKLEKVPALKELKNSDIILITLK